MKTYKTGTELVGAAAHFKKMPFFQSFTDQHILEILKASKMLVYESGEVIIPQGGLGDKLFILFSGKANVIKDQLWVATIETVGEMFGEMSMLGGDARSASVIAVGTTWCLSINMTFLKRLSLEDRNACYTVLYGLIAKTIAERLKQTTEELALVHKELELVKGKLERLRRERQA